MSCYGDTDSMQMDDMIGCISDTANMMAQTQVNNIGLSIIAAHNAGALANEVEFWRWLGQNYNCLDDANAIKDIAKRSPEWLRKILQGKGYEWDFMTQQRNMLRNLFSKFDAGTSPTQMGIDITKKSIFSDIAQEYYQNKAYTSGNTPDLHNTPKSVMIVTNAENVKAVEDGGYSVIPFQDNDTIKKQTDSRMKKAQNGTVINHYTPKSIIGTMIAAGIGAAVVGIGIETVASYKCYKRGKISKQEYIKEILISGAVSGTTGASTAGIMIPISGAVTAAGIAQPWLIPVSFILSSGINKIVSPIFKRGEYLKLLNEAKYYQSFSDMLTGLYLELENSFDQYKLFINRIADLRSSFSDVLTLNVILNNEQQILNDKLASTKQFEELNSFIESI